MQIFEIKDAVVEEVSFVDKGANKRKFHIIKSEEGGSKNMDELKKLYKELFGAEPDAQVSDLLKSVETEYITKATEALTIINKHKEEMPEEVVKAIETLASNFIVVKEAKEEKATPVAEVKKEDEKPNVPEVKVEKEEKPAETPVIKNSKGEEVFEIDLDEFHKNVEDKARIHLNELGYQIPEKQ
jgi:hypothetical protein